MIKLSEGHLAWRCSLPKFKQARKFMLLGCEMLFFFPYYLNIIISKLKRARTL